MAVSNPPLNKSPNCHSSLSYSSLAPRSVRYPWLICVCLSMSIVVSYVIFWSHTSFPLTPRIVPDTNISLGNTIGLNITGVYLSNKAHWSLGKTWTNSKRHASSGNLPMVYVVTPTYRRLGRIAKLTRLAQTLMHVPSLHWMVVEDAFAFSRSVRDLLLRCGMNFTHMLGPKPRRFARESAWKMPRGVSSRIAGLRWVQNHVRNGVLHFADDENTYDIRLFEEMRSTKKVSMWPVGLVGYLAENFPVVVNGDVIGFFNSWMGGPKFPVPMAGFAVNIAFLLQHPKAKIPFAVGYEEDGFLRSLDITLADIEPKAHNCIQVLVWQAKTKSHNLTRNDFREYKHTNIYKLRRNSGF